jgi:hypothetical protein
VEFVAQVEVVVGVPNVEECFVNRYGIASVSGCSNTEKILEFS